jgi:hypothetical protein
MTKKKEYWKDPDDRLDYLEDWTKWLKTDTIVTSTWSVPSGITKEAESNTTTTTTIWLSGGTADYTYEIVNHIVTAAGREKDRTIVFHILNG